MLRGLRLQHLLSLDLEYLLFVCQYQSVDESVVG